MSVLIKGMKMPRNCETCEYQTKGACFASGVNKGTITIRRMDKERPDWCPLVEIKTPHGRLIDADAFAEFIEDVIKRQHYENVTIDKALTVTDVLTAVIDDLKGNVRVKYESNPTVIEAEGEG